MPSDIIPVELIESKIFVFRGKKVMLDRDLAKLYSVLTKVLNQAVRRNQSRFPEDFMFQLTDQESQNLRSQIVTSSLRSQFVALNLGLQIAPSPLRRQIGTLE